MIITGADLAKLTQYMTGTAAKFIVKMTPTKFDDTIVEALERIGGDQELLDKLATWLNWLPMFGANEGDESFVAEPELVGCCEDLRPGLSEWRTHIAGAK